MRLFVPSLQSWVVQRAGERQIDSRIISLRCIKHSHGERRQMSASGRMWDAPELAWVPDVNDKADPRLAQGH